MIVKLGNGNTITIDDITRSPKAEATDWLLQYKARKGNIMEPTIETSTSGISAIFPDGAVITITATGRFPCTHCGDGQCEHFHAALPYWNRFRWEMAEREDSPWGPRLLIAIGISPPFIVLPDAITRQTRWAPFGAGEAVAPGVRMWYTIRGKLFRFGNEGHVYLGDDHPDGHTPCLVCRDGCDHVARALELEAQT